MKTNKEQVYDFISLHFKGSPRNGISTKYIADALNLQRTNVSSILSALVAENKIEKTNGRPVLYYMKSDSMDAEKESSFHNLVGYNGSLKRAVQLAKAAILYPQKSLNSVIIGAHGVGKSFLAMLMHKFAVEADVLLPDALFAVFDCKKYADNERQAICDLFGDDSNQGYFAAARRGVLLIDNVQYLGADFRSTVITRAEAAETDGETEDLAAPLILVSCDSKNRTACDDFTSRFPIIIELPALSERPFEERMEMIQRFLALESVRIGKKLLINAELLRCLLLYDCEANCMQLKSDIKIGCANAYVREHSSCADTLQLFVGDFEHHVRKGFLKYQANRDEIERIIPSNYNYAFSVDSIEKSMIDKGKPDYRSVYDELDRRALSLTEKGFKDDEISLILSTEIETEFRKVQNQFAGKAVNKEQLAMFADKRIIAMTEEFLDNASLRLERSFSNAVFCGMCLHLDALVNHRGTDRGISAQKISDIIGNCKAEYTLSLSFSKKLGETFGMEIPIEEVALITLFTCYQAPITDTTKNPVVLFAFYGDGVANSISRAIAGMTQLENVFSFELKFENDTVELYDALRQYIMKIEQGKGVIVVYDGNILEEMLLSIEEELHIVIRQVPIPILSVGIELARKAVNNENIDLAYQSALKSLNLKNFHDKRVIVTLCTTGEGGAEELKRYIESYGQLGDVDIIPLAISDRDRLHDQLAKIMNSSIIQCIIGTFNPKLFALPFLSISEIFSTPKEKLPELLKMIKQEKNSIDYNAVFDYLKEQLDHTNIAKLKILLPQLMAEINKEICEISADSEVGLFVHIACCVDRMRSHSATPKNMQKESILAKYNWQFKVLLKLVKPLEKAFDIIFTDDEAANILAIIYQF